MTTTYLACAALDQIDAAQATLDAHPATVDGTCLRCRTVTCVRCDALATLARYGRLPQRRPGASGPDQLKRATGAFRWFTLPNPTVMRNQRDQEESRSWT